MCMVNLNLALMEPHTSADKMEPSTSPDVLADDSATRVRISTIILYNK